MRSLLIVIAFAAACAPVVTPQTVTTVPVGRPSCAPLAAIDSVGLMSDVFRLAHDSMRGRFIGSPEGVKGRDFLAARFDAIGLKTLPPGRVHPIVVTPSPSVNNINRAWNVVGMVVGTTTPDKYIVVTAHYDHLGIGRAVGGDSIYNGADDNASGASALITLAKHFMAMPPKHSVIFAAVDGEERGMWGSRHFVDAPTVPLDRILLNVNMDMIGRNVKHELYAAGPGKYPQLRAIVDAVAACAPVTLLLGHDTPAAGPGNDWTSQSDQESFHRKGIPFVYFGEEDHPDYHKPSDHADRLMPGFYVNAVRTVADMVRKFDGSPIGR